MFFLVLELPRGKIQSHNERSQEGPVQFFVYVRVYAKTWFVSRIACEIHHTTIFTIVPSLCGIMLRWRIRLKYTKLTAYKSQLIVSLQCIWFIVYSGDRFSQRFRAAMDSLDYVFHLDVYFSYAPPPAAFRLSRFGRTRATPLPLWSSDGINKNSM